MYKFVKEEKIINMEKEIDLLQKEIESKYKEIVYLKSEKNDIKNTNKVLNERIRELYRSNSSLISSNNYLIEWVKKIMNDVGTYKVDDKKKITIPTYTREERPYSANMEDVDSGYIRPVKDITIPEIRIVEMR